MDAEVQRADALARELASDAPDFVIEVDPAQSEHTLVGVYDASTDRHVIVTVPHDARSPIEIQYASLQGPVNAKTDVEAAGAIVRLLRAPRRPSGLRRLLDW